CVARYGRDVRGDFVDAVRMAAAAMGAAWHGDCRGALFGAELLDEFVFRRRVGCGWRRVGFGRAAATANSAAMAGRGVVRGGGGDSGEHATLRGRAARGAADDGAGVDAAAGKPAD